MARELTISDATHGPSGEELSDYVVENIPALWHRTIERVGAVVNTGSDYNGTVAGLAASDIETDKLFWFSPNQTNGVAARLSINADAYRNVLRPDGTPTVSGDLVAGLYYMLMRDGDNYLLIYDSTTALALRNQALAAQVAAEAARDEAVAAAATLLGSPRDYPIGVYGQSNSITEFAWTGAAWPSTVQMWNWDGTEDGLGDAFEALDNTKISFSWVVGRELVRRQPNIRPRIIRVGWGGIPISHFLWLNYEWDTGLAGDPGAGKIAGNNADTSLITELRISETDRDGINRLSDVLKLNTADADEVRIELDGDENTFLRLDPTTGYTDHGAYHSINVTFIGRNNPVGLLDGSEVKVQIAPFAYTTALRETQAALAELELNKLEEVFWYLGESNVTFPQSYVSDLLAVRQRMISDEIIDAATPWTIMGTVDSRMNGVTAFDRFAFYQQLPALLHPSVFTYVEMGDLPSDHWDPAVPSFLHPNAIGLDAAGRRAVHTPSRPQLHNPVTQQLLIPNVPTDVADLAFQSSNFLGTDTGFKDRGGGSIGIRGTGLVVSKAGAGYTIDSEAEGLMQLLLRSVLVGAAGANVNLGHSRGTIAARAALAQNDILGTLNFQGHDGATYRTGVNLFGQVIAATPSATDFFTQFVLQLVATGAATPTTFLSGQHSSGLSLMGGVIFNALRHLILRSYTVATLPTATGAGQVIYVSDGTTNKRLAVSDNANWRWPDGAVVT